MHRIVSPLAVVIVAVSVGLISVGCGGTSAKPKPVAIRGSVTLDGSPLTEATIAFVASDGSPPRQFSVKDGKFDGQVPPGSYSVAVKAYRPMKNPPKLDPNGPGGPPDTNEQYLPEKYNASTELKADIPPDGGPELTFSLKSDAPKGK